MVSKMYFKHKPRLLNTSSFYIYIYIYIYIIIIIIIIIVMIIVIVMPTEDGALAKKKRGTIKTRICGLTRQSAPLHIGQLNQRERERRCVLYKELTSS